MTITNLRGSRTIDTEEKESAIPNNRDTELCIICKLMSDQLYTSFSSFYQHLVC